MPLNRHDTGTQYAQEKEPLPGDYGAILSNLSEAELLQLRAEVDATLGITTMADIDIGHEVALQLRTAKVLLGMAMNDDEANPSQKASTCSTVQRIVQDLTKMRINLYSAERNKQIEEAVINVMRDQSTEIKDAFFADYERILSTHDTGLGAMGYSQPDNDNNEVPVE